MDPMGDLDDDVIAVRPYAEELARSRQVDFMLLGAYLNGLPARNSHVTAASSLDKVARLLGVASAADVPWSRVGPVEAARIRAALLDSGLKPTTVNTYMAHVRGLLKVAWLQGHLDADTYLRCREALGNVRNRDRGYRALTRGELTALFDAVELPKEGAALALMTCGLRRSEVADLDASDLDREVGHVVVRGKGNVTRRVALRNGAAAWIDLHLGDRTEGPVFDTASGGQWVYRVVKRLGRRADVVDVSPHRLRSTCATMLAQRGVPLTTVATVLGHASVSTTMRYVTTLDEEAWAAMDELHVPAPDPDRFPAAGPREANDA